MWRTRGNFIQCTAPHRLSQIRNKCSSKQWTYSPPSTEGSHLPPGRALHGHRPSNSSAISSGHRSSRIRKRHLPPVHHHRGCSAHDRSQRQKLGCRQQAHHRGCCAPSLIICHHPCPIQLRLPPLQMIPRRQPTYDWYDQSISDTHKVTTHLPSWKIALRKMKTKTLPTT